MEYRIRIRLKELLEDKELTQKKLSELTGIRESTISDIARESRTVMNFQHIAKIAKILNIQDIRELIELTIE